MSSSSILYQVSKALSNQYKKERWERVSLKEPSTRLKIFCRASIDQNRDRTSKETRLKLRNPFISKIHSLENIEDIITRD